MTVTPYHSDEEGIEVYHVCNNCGPGSQIKNENKTYGTGGLSLCEICEELLRDGNCR